MFTKKKMKFLKIFFIDIRDVNKSELVDSLLDFLEYKGYIFLVIFLNEFI